MSISYQHCKKVN